MEEKENNNPNGLPFTPFGYKLLKSFLPIGRVLSLVCKPPKPIKEMVEMDVQYVKRADLYFWSEAATPIAWSYTYWLLWTMAICFAIIDKSFLWPAVIVVGTMIVMMVSYKQSIKLYYEILHDIKAGTYYPDTPEFNAYLSELIDENLNMPCVKAMAIHRDYSLLEIGYLKQKSYKVEKIGIQLCIIATCCHLLFR